MTENRATNPNTPDPDFLEAVETVSTEIDSRRNFGERIQEGGRTLRLLIELILCKWRGR
jgi:hypothetical protein